MAGMKFFKILTYSVSGLFSSHYYSSLFLNIGAMKEYKSNPKRKGSLMATVKCHFGKVVNQSSSLVKERFLSYYFEISHEKISSEIHGISRIVKGIDFRFISNRIKELKSAVCNYHEAGFSISFSDEQNPSFLTKKLYLPNGNLQLSSIYVINDYIRRANGMYISYT